MLSAIFECSAVIFFLKTASDFLKFHPSVAAGLNSGQSDREKKLCRLGGSHESYGVLS